MTLKELETRIRMLEDVKEIENLQKQYVYWLYNRQSEGIPDCFTEDATVEIYKRGLRRGKAEISRLIRDEVLTTNWGKDRDMHHLIMPLITVDGDKARGQWLLYILVSAPIPGHPGQWLNGKYDNEYIKVNGKWKISKLTWTYPWPITPESYPKPV